MIKDEFFSYYWFLDEREENVTSIRVYGLNNKNENVCIRVDDFQPYIYFELPENIEWTVSKAQLLGDKIDFIMREHKPLKKRLDMKYRLYGANLNSKGEKKLFPYLYCSFSNKNDIKKAFYITKKPLNIIGLGNINLKMHEQDADPILQFVSNKDIPTAGWIYFAGKEVKKDDKITYCEKEYIVSWENVKKVNKDMVGKPKIMGFDIEVNSTNPSAMPKAEIQGDKIFQISCVFSRFGETEDDYDIYLLTLGEPDPEIVGENVTIYMYDSEIELLEGFTELITTENPNIIVGYNILGFDIPYMIDRAKFPCLCFNKFDKMGFNKFAHAKEKTIKWSSSAYGNQEFQFLDAEGRLFIDLLPLIKRDYKMNNYTLKTVSDFFIGDKKDDLSAKGIFKCYRIGTKKEKDGSYSSKAKKAMGVVGKYCIQDTALVMRLMEKIQTWVGLTEQAATYNTSIFSIYTQGQQIKVYSQVYKYCIKNNIVVEKDGYVTKENERYVGAHVFPPVPGLYEGVLPFDFASLYPTTIIAYNIDYSTLVTDDSISDEKCNVMSWEDHISCEHDPKVIKKNKLTKYIDSQKEKLTELRNKRDNKLNKLIKQDIIDEINKIVEDLKPFTKERSDIVKKLSKNPMCEKRYYRFLKEPKGVMPTILQTLLDARKNTRKTIKENNKKIENTEDEKEIDNIKRLNNVLDKRQLAYKVSANSMYGAMGVKKGYLPFMPGAMVTTYMGRVNIELVAKTIPEKYGGQLVYGDTDCVLATEPVLIQYLEKEKIIIDYKTVEEISNGIWTRINPNKEISKAKKGFKIWSDKGFTNIINVVRCGIKKPLSRVLIHVGVVNCSNEHSLLSENLEKICPSDIKIGDKLCISNLPLPEDTPLIPKYNNKLTVKLIEEYKIPEFEYNGLTAELAFVWGLFFADGSCGTYMCKNGYNKSTWALNNKDNKLLQRCLYILIKNEKSISFKILDTMKSSNVNKLVGVQFSKKIEQSGTLVHFVNKYRNLFYDTRKYKKIPSIIFNSPLQIRESFFMGYYAGDGSKKDPSISLSNKGAIGSAGLFYLMKSIGYQVSVNTRNDKPDIYKLTGSNPKKKQRYEPNAVKKIIPIKIQENEYIYDIQTENHHFSTGVGELVVHNSNYITFPHLKSKTASETWDYAIMVAREVSKLFPQPIKLEYEEAIYNQFFILTKKRYLYTSCNREGEIDKKIGKRGVAISRRDNSLLLRILYEKVIQMIFDRVKAEDILYFLLEELNKVCSKSSDYSNFVLTKSIKDVNNMELVSFKDEKGKIKGKIGDYIVSILPNNKKEREEQLKKKEADTEEEYYAKCLPAVVQLAEKMRNRGMRVDQGSRIEYVITDNGVANDKQYNKLENLDYFLGHSDILKIDYMYYIKLLCNPIDEMLNVAFKDMKKDFMLEQYELRLKRTKLLNQIKELHKPKLKLLN